MRIFKELGRTALGSRVRYLGDAITASAEGIYKLYDIKMNPKWFPVFYVLSQDNEKTITSIAEDIGHSHASVSKIVGEMITAGLVKEKRGTTDKRRTMVCLSNLGKNAVAKFQISYEDVNFVIEELSRESQHDLWEALAEWEEFFKKATLLERVRARKLQRESSMAKKKESTLLKNKDTAVEIVPYSKKYRTAFRDLNLEWIKKYFKVEQADRDALDDPEGYILERGGFIFVALLDHKPVGVCALIRRDDKRFPLELSKMAVSPLAQGKGVGLLLGEAVIAKARSLKAKNVFLESNTILKPAISLYKKLGFKKVLGCSTLYERCNIQMELKLSHPRATE